VLVDPDLRFAEVELQPRLLFEDRAIWETVLKLKAQIGSDDPTDRMYADSLGGVLAHELLRLNGNIQSSRGSSPRRACHVATEARPGVHGRTSCRGCINWRSGGSCPIESVSFRPVF
jgi:hypothetical protein